MTKRQYFTTDIHVDGNNLSTVLGFKPIISLLVCLFGLIGNGLSIFIILVLKEYKKSVLHMWVSIILFKKIFLHLKLKNNYNLLGKDICEC